MKDYILLLVLVILFAFGFYLMKKLDAFLKDNPKFSKHGTTIHKSEYKIPIDKMKENGVLILEDMDKPE